MIERSRYTANQLLYYSDSSSVFGLKRISSEVVDYLGGMNHLSQIVYFLENPSAEISSL